MNERGVDRLHRVFIEFGTVEQRAQAASPRFPRHRA
jgi:hypothetical protein